MVVGDPTTGRFIELSPAAVRLMGNAVNYLDVVEPQDASAETLRLLSDGLIEGARTRRRLRRPNGAVIEVHAIGWVVRLRMDRILGLGCL
jgi:hypothetical protein